MIKLIRTIFLIFAYIIIFSMLRAAGKSTPKQNIEDNDEISFYEEK